MDDPLKTQHVRAGSCPEISCPPTLNFRVLAAAVLLLFTGCVTSRSTPEGEAAAAADSGDGFESYSSVVTNSMDSDGGLFTVHRDQTTILFEVPDSVLGNEMLLVTRIARTHSGLGYGGEKANTQVVRWQREGDRLLLRVVSYESVASEEHPIYEAVRNANLEPIVAAFDIQARSEDSARSVIDVTELFTTDVDLLGLSESQRSNHEISGLDEDRSFVNWARAFPRNIEVRHTLTYDADEPPSNPSTGTVTVEMNQSMVLLPEDRMTPRPCDGRVGYFSVEMIDYGADVQRAEEQCYITRWRLEPSDSAAFARGERVEPTQPIVYYIDPATPLKWRPYIKQGVEDWNAAFEEAGFLNAIRAADPPSPDDDPDFSPEDVRYSVIRYFPSDVQNAYGPHVHDPRTGEILESDIGWYHNVMNLLRNWYFIQTAAVNPDARRVELEDEVMGELIRFVAAHEVGHTLGLPHNWGSSYAYPVDSLRSPTFTSRHGTAPSIMDYARFNYIAQPGDGVTNFLPAVGEYDRWAIRWGYRPLPQAGSRQEQEGLLHEWIAEVSDDPRFFYGRQSAERIDPRAQNEDLGNDPVTAGEYGIANLQRLIPNLVDWTYRQAEDYDQLRELYEQVVAQWNRYLGHAARQIGGVHETPRTYDQDGLVYETVPQAMQARSMAFLQRAGFQTPEWLLSDDVLRRIEPAGIVDRIRASQATVLDVVLDPRRLARLLEAEARLGEDTYTASDMLEDLREGLWRELDARSIIDPYRRNVQRAYLEDLEELMTEEDASSGSTPVDVSQSDIRAYVRGELETLREDIREAMEEGNDDRPTLLHLRDVLARIERILDPQDAASNR